MRPKTTELEHTLSIVRNHCLFPWILPDYEIQCQRNFKFIIQSCMHNIKAMDLSVYKYVFHQSTTINE